MPLCRGGAITQLLSLTQRKKPPHYVPSPWTQAAAVLNPQYMQQRGNKANIPCGKMSVMGKYQSRSPELRWVWQRNRDEHVPCTQAGKLYLLGKNSLWSLWGFPVSGKGEIPFPEKERGSASVRNIVKNWNRLPRWSPHLWRDLEQVHVALGDMG